MEKFTREKVRALYLEREMTMEETARLLGTSKSTICRYIRLYGLEPRKPGRARLGEMIADEVNEIENN